MLRIQLVSGLSSNGINCQLSDLTDSGDEGTVETGVATNTFDIEVTGE